MERCIRGMSVFGGTFWLVRGRSTGRVPVVPGEKYVKFTPELKNHFWLLKGTPNPWHPSYYMAVAEASVRVAPASQASTGESGPARFGKGHRPQPRQLQKSKRPQKSQQTRTTAGASGVVGEGFALQTKVAALRKGIAPLRSSSLSEQQQHPQHHPFGPPRPPHLAPQQ